jgi:hypothetical protein
MTVKPRIESAVLFAVGFAIISAVINISYVVNNPLPRSEQVCFQ